MIKFNIHCNYNNLIKNLFYFKYLAFLSQDIKCETFCHCTIYVIKKNVNLCELSIKEFFLKLGSFLYFLYEYQSQDFCSYIKLQLCILIKKVAIKLF